MSIKYYVVDAFSALAFGGNPAAVCILDAPLDDLKLQAIAAEFNLSETAYLIHQGADTWELRWFTPATEVNLCGHATLASAWVLWHEMGFEIPALRFLTRSGELTATRTGDGATLNFPLIPTAPLGAEDNLSALFPEAQAIAIAGEDLLLELNDEAAIGAYIPNLPAITALPYRGVIITAAAEHKPYQIASRFFAPRFGINEDSVTGSMHCALADYWGKKLQLSQFVALQASARKGVLRVELLGARVALWGQAVVTMEGNLRV